MLPKQALSVQIGSVLLVSTASEISSPVRKMSDLAEMIVTAALPTTAVWIGRMLIPNARITAPEVQTENARLTTGVLAIYSASMHTTFVYNR